MCYHPKCREWHAPDHQAWATVGQTSLLKAERARQNRAYVRKLLQERQPEFAAALAAAKEQIVRQRSAPDVTAGHKPEKRSSTGPVPSLQAVWRAYEVYVQAPSPNADIVHTSVVYFIDPGGKERFAASPMVDHESNGTAYLPLAQQAAWGHGIALIASQLAR